MVGETGLIQVGQDSKKMLQQSMQQQPIKTATQTGGWGTGTAGQSGWAGMPGLGSSFLGNNQTPKDPNSPMGQLDSLNASHPYEKSLKWRDMFKQMGYGMQPHVLNALDFYGQMQPQQFSMIRNAMSALNPANKQGRVEQYRRDATGQSLDQAQSHMGMLGNLDENTRNAIILGAMNNGNQAGNEFMNQQYNPEQDVRNAMAAAGLLSPESANPYLNAYQSAVMQGDVNNPKNSGGGLMGALTGAVGMATGLGWSPLSKAKK